MADQFDVHMLPLFVQQKKDFGNNDSFDLFAYLQLHSTVDLGVAFAELFCLSIIIVDGCYLRRKNADVIYLDPKPHGLHEQQSIEVMHNHLHMYDLFPYADSQTPLGAYEHFAQLLLSMWKQSLHAQYPDVHFHLSYQTEPEAYGPTITFWHTEDGLSQSR